MRGSRRSKRATLDEALSGGTVAVIPGFQGVSRRRPAWRRSAAADRTRRRSRSPPASRPTAATSTPTSTASTPPTRASCPSARKLDQVTFEEMLELAGVGAKVLQVRSVGLAMRENMPLARAVGVRGQAGHRYRRRAFGSGHGKKPDRRHRRRPQRGADHADRRARPAGHGRGGHRRRSPRPASRST